MPKVTQEHLDARRNQILDAAWECFARKGYHQSTMQDICQESGLSPGAIYRYFASKEAILKAIMDRSTEMMRDLIEIARSEAEGPLDALELVGQAMFSYFNDPMFETSGRLDIEILPEFLRNEALRENMKNQLTFWRTAITQLMAEAKEKGELRAEVDLEVLAILMICAWLGLRQFRLFDPENVRPEPCLDLMWTLVSGNPLVEAEKGEKALQRPGTPLPQQGRGRKEAVDAPVQS